MRALWFGYVTGPLIGAAWTFKEGEGYVVRLTSIPTQWDGSFILVPPKDPD